MSNDQSTRALRRLLGDRIVAYNAVIARALGSVTAGLLLSQFMYWQERAKNDGWFWKTRDEIAEETALSRYEQETARKALLRFGVIEEKRMGVPARMHFRVNIEAVVELLAAVEDATPDGTDGDRANQSGGPPPTERIPPTGRGETSQPDGGNPTNRLGENPPTITESTREYPESTAETPAAEPIPFPVRELVPVDPAMDVSAVAGPSFTLRPDAEARLHQAATRDRAPAKSRTAGPGATESPLRDFGQGWNDKDATRIRQIFTTGVDPNDGKVVYPGGYPTDSGGMKPRKADINLIFTTVPRTRASDLLRALRNYADWKTKNAGAQYIRRLGTWIEKGEWEDHVTRQPDRVNARLSSAPQTEAPTHQGPYAEIAATRKLGRVLEA